jgi:hypothetical protein
MAKPVYQIIVEPLNVANLDKNLLPPGVQYDGLTIIELPGGAGAGVTLRFGGNNQPVPMRLEGQGWAFKDVCGNPFQCDEGLFLTNPATGGNLVIFLSVGGMKPQN